jgi:hypothetical protein
MVIKPVCPECSDIGQDAEARIAQAAVISYWVDVRRLGLCFQHGRYFLFIATGYGLDNSGAGVGVPVG